MQIELQNLKDNGNIGQEKSKILTLNTLVNGMIAAKSLIAWAPLISMWMMNIKLDFYEVYAKSEK